MTMKEVASLTGYAESTVRKYAPQLGIEYFGSGQHKVYNWKKADIDRLKKVVIGRGRPTKKEI